ncbi:MAG: class I SAM-dependent methyltransferase [Hyphomicrobiaceae bacterium]
MVNHILDMGLQAATQAVRFGWYLGLNRAVGWQSDRLGQRPRYKAARPVPSETEILADLAQLYLRDATAVRDGIFPPRGDGMTPARHLARARAMLADLPSALDRRQRRDADSVREMADTVDVPDYYAQDFHFQTGGYLTEESASLYDVQVETLFLGGAGPMRREALSPIAAHFKGRDQRRLALTDVACGTGRFLRDVRLTWPALKLTGVDLSASYLAEARRHLQPLRPAELVRANAEAMPLADASQDAVTSIFLFHELPRHARRQITAEMARITKPGGIVVLVDSLQMGDRPAWDGLLEGFPVRFHEPYFRDYAIDDLEEHFVAAGLAVQSVWTSFLAKVIVAVKPGA